jgi:hypothetical protein
VTQVRSSIDVPRDVVLGLLGSADENQRALERSLNADLHVRGNAVTLTVDQNASFDFSLQKSAVRWNEISEYQARAAASREPVAISTLGAIPVIPRPALRPSQNGQRSGVSWNSDFLGKLVAAAVIVTAINLLLPDSRAGDGSGPDADPWRRAGQLINERSTLTCAGPAGLNHEPTILGGC